MPNQSVRFDADGEDYTAALSLGTTFTILVWARIAVDRNNYSAIFGLDSNNGTTGAVVMETISDGTSLVLAVSGGSTDVVINSMTVGSWYCYAVTRSALSGADALQVRWGTSPGSLTTVSAEPGAGWAAGSFSRLQLGESAWGGEWLNGSLAFVKVYTRVLDGAEIATELGQYSPGAASGLQAAFSFWDGPSIVDLSGNGHTLVGGVGVSAEAGPTGIPDTVSPPEDTPYRVTVGATPVLLTPADTGPVGRRVVVRNTNATAANTVSLGGTSGVTAGNGFLLSGGAQLVLPLSAGEELWAVRGGASDVVVHMLRLGD